MAKHFPALTNTVLIGVTNVEECFLGFAKIIKTSQASINKQEAIEILRDQCEENNWRLQDLQPLLIKERLRSYEIWTNSDGRGGMLIINLDLYNGKVKSVKTLPM